MNTQIINKLNKINQKFYSQISDDFSQTRQSPWQGWKEIHDKVLFKYTNTTLLRVLDIGCGNGRFGNFLNSITDAEIEYCGLDASKELLTLAEDQLNPRIKKTLIETNLLKPSWQRQVVNLEFDLVVLMGVMHHIPSRANRARLLKESSRFLVKNGCLMVSFWQYNKDPRFNKKVLDPKLYDLDEDELESGDYLIKWNNTGVRYAHMFSDQEIDEYAQELSLTIVASFEADGKIPINKYLILKRE